MRAQTAWKPKGNDGGAIEVRRRAFVQLSENDSALVGRYLAAALSASTQRSYQNDLKHFFGWGGQIPAAPELVATYLAQHAETHSVSTLARRLVALLRAHKARGFPSPTESELVRATMQGIRRKCGKPQRRAAPLLKADLVSAVKDLKGLRGLRDKAVLLIGFAAALRRSELVGLDVNDLEFVDEGVILRLRRSKTDQEGKGRDIAVPYVRGRCCPVRALQMWIKVSGVTGGPVFRRIDKSNKILPSRLTAQWISMIVKQRVEAIGLDPTSFSGHSLRAGFVTSAANSGAQSADIRAQTGHQTESMLQRYVRRGRMFCDNANCSIW